MSLLKTAFVLFISIGGAYYYGYIEGQIKARAEIFGENVKRVDRKRRRY